jgi:2-iminoacetate synthase
MLGITHKSAGSKTDLGGYSIKVEVVEQFEISDIRTPVQVTNVI